MPVDGRCPRCGTAFVCGADGSTACDCFAVNLSDATRAVLRDRYTTCLCLACLRDVQAQTDTGATPDVNASTPSSAR